MGRPLTNCAWPLARLPELLQHFSGTGSPQHDLPRTPPDLDSGTLDTWIAAVGDFVGLEVEAATLPYSGLQRSLRCSGPALLRLQIDGQPCFVLTLGGSARSLRLLGTDLSVHRVPADTVIGALCSDLESPAEAATDKLLETANIGNRRRPKVRRAIIRDRLRSRHVNGCWLLRLPPGASFWRQLRQVHVPGRCALLAAVNLTQDALFIGSWWVLGAGAMQGRLDPAWLTAWVLLLLTIVPCRILSTWLQGSIAISAGGALKQRLLAGALRLDPDEIRLEGAGQLLGRVLESQAVESLALSGGFLALVAGIEIVFALAVLAASGIWTEPLLLVLWLAATVTIAWRYFVTNNRWTGARLDMTHELVERMVGHRTRLAQEHPDTWHCGEDASLEQYLAISQTMDRAAALLTAAAPRGWLLVAIAALAPGFVTGGASAAQLAITVGGILLAFRALKRLSGSLWQLTGAAIAWRRTSLLFHAAARPAARGSSLLAATADSHGESGTPVLEASDVLFRYNGRTDPVLRGCTLRVNRGDRILLEGPSGGGKSTLAAVITGLRSPDSGLLLLNGLDRHTLGDGGWRRHVVSAPQFHENHVLTGTFAFNLMMGWHWPPDPDDFEEMESLCRELGLGELLERMPAGLLQCVGDTGWQLSHGERSRLFMARALLQKPDLVVLDESFAALDPENLRRAVTCVLARANTVLVIAHP